MGISRYREGSAITVTAKFQAADDSSVTPTAVQYRIDCETTGQAILDWTAFPPAAVMQIPVTASQNAIVNQKNKVERKIMQIQANPGTDSQVTDISEWDIARNAPSRTNGAGYSTPCDYRN